jgi:flagellar hook-basal body complex protein FliE
MTSRIDLVTRSLEAFQQQSDVAKKTTVPVLPEGSDSAFGNALTKFLNGASDAGDASADLTKRFANGDNVEMHQVMAASEEASLALDLVIALRDKAVDSYRTIINMQS